MRAGLAALKETDGLLGKVGRTADRERSSRSCSSTPRTVPGSPVQAGILTAAKRGEPVLAGLPRLPHRRSIDVFRDHSGPVFDANSGSPRHVLSRRH